MDLAAMKDTKGNGKLMDDAGPQEIAARLKVPADANARKRRAPDFFVVGQPKSGTTALYEMLKLHPQIYMPEGKEPRFFATEMYYRNSPRPTGTPTTLEEYLSWFDDARPDQLIAEASPWYLWSRSAAGRIAEVNPDARIIAVVREPASLLRSLHLEFVQIYVETETDLRTAISLEAERRQGRQIPRHTYWPQMLQYAEHVQTAEQLRRYYDVFPEEQILVLVYDDFRDDNVGTLRRVLRFLGVDDTVSLELREANPTVRVRSQRLHELLHALYVGHGPVSRVLKASVKAVTWRRLRRNAVVAAQQRFLYTEPDPPDDEFMIELRRRFKGEVVALSEFLGRDLVTLWGYDRLD
jgi:Sulfotransferase domain